MLSIIERGRLRSAALRARQRILRIVHDTGCGHVGAALSQADILVALYLHTLRLERQRPDWPERDRLVMSRGDGGLGLAAVLAECGFLDPEQLTTFGKTGSALGMHTDHRKVAFVENGSGSLGHGLGIATGMAMGARLKGWPSRTFCLLSDGECYEGSTWEAAMSASAHGLNQLVAIVDRNRLTLDDCTGQELPLEPLPGKWEAFGWRCLRCDGHDMESLCAALDQATMAREKDSRPTVIIAHTVKGKGVDFMEEQARWHDGALAAGVPA